MDMIAAVTSYMERIINDVHLDGMKALLLDNETTTIVSMVMSQSQILQREIFLVEPLGTSHEPMEHLKAAVFVRPTSENIDLLKLELRNPKYSEYHIFFSNIAPIELLEKLADADEQERIHQVHEYYADFLAVGDALFHFNLKGTVQLSIKPENRTPTSNNYVINMAGAGVLPESAQLFSRTVEGVLAALLSLKKRPIIRFSKSSDITEKLAREVSARMQLEQKDGLFDFRRSATTPLLYVFDRKDDPVTPLLSQWSYQAMVHELLNLQDNCVDLSKAPNVRPENQQLVLSVTTDTFFRSHWGANFGDLGIAIKGLVEDYQKQTKSHEKLDSIDGMQKFLDNYPAFRSQSLAVSKHVALMGELARRVEVDCLMDVSQLEQELACGDDHTAHLKELITKIQNGKIKPMNKLRLALLYALRYETHSSVQLNTVKDLLQSSGGLKQEQIAMVDAILTYGGAKVRQGDLYGDRAYLKKYVRAMAQGVQGVDNVYAQHVPPLIKKLELILKGQHLDNDFGVVNERHISNTRGPGGSHSDATDASGAKSVKDVFVFVCGGVTYEEALKVAELNTKVAATGQRIVLGGTTIHNSSSFLRELADTFGLHEKAARKLSWGALDNKNL